MQRRGRQAAAAIDMLTCLQLIQPLCVAGLQCCNNIAKQMPHSLAHPCPSGRWNEEVAAASEEVKRTRLALVEVQAGLATLVRVERLRQGWSK